MHETSTKKKFVYSLTFIRGHFGYISASKELSLKSDWAEYFQALKKKKCIHEQIFDYALGMGAVVGHGLCLYKGLSYTGMQCEGHDMDVTREYWPVPRSSDLPFFGRSK